MIFLILIKKQGVVCDSNIHKINTKQALSTRGFVIYFLNLPSFPTTNQNTKHSLKEHFLHCSTGYADSLDTQVVFLTLNGTEQSRHLGRGLLRHRVGHLAHVRTLQLGTCDAPLDCVCDGLQRRLRLLHHCQVVAGACKHNVYKYINRKQKNTALLAVENQTVISQHDLSFFKYTQDKVRFQWNADTIR